MGVADWKLAKKKPLIRVFFDRERGYVGTWTVTVEEVARLGESGES